MKRILDRSCDSFDDEPFDLPHITVDVLDPEIVGEILGPDGIPLSVVVEDRPPFGFCR